MKFVAYLSLLTFHAVHAGTVRKRQPCPQVCDAAHCPEPPRACYYGLAKDACGCCAVCAAGEGEACGERGGAIGGLTCGDGLRCNSVGVGRGLHGSCVCISSGPVCGSDARTYPSICRLRAENRRAELGEINPVTLAQRGRCNSGE